MLIFKCDCCDIPLTSIDQQYIVHEDYEISTFCSSCVKDYIFSNVLSNMNFRSVHYALIMRANGERHLYTLPETCTTKAKENNHETNQQRAPKQCTKKTQ